MVATEYLDRKWRTFRREPKYSVLLKVATLNRFLQPHAQRVLFRRGYLDFLTDRPANAIPPDFADLLFLYRTVRATKPACILEFGSGCSTVIFAQALWENAHEVPDAPGRLFSLDADHCWAGVTSRSIPRHLDALCEVRYTPVVEIDYAGERAWRHTAIPQVHPDLVYLDGPALTPEVEVAVDLLDLESRLAPTCVVIVDGRWQNTKFLRKHFRRPYRFKHHLLLFNSVFEFTP